MRQKSFIQKPAKVIGSILFLLCIAACSEKKNPNDPQHDLLREITAQEIANHTRILASDEYGGRPPSGPLAEKTVTYLKNRLKALGLKPVFGDSYLQTVPLVSITANPQAVLSVSSRVEAKDYAYGSEMMVWTTQVVEVSSLQDSEIVFVGYGINAPEFGWNDYDGIDMAGKTALILVNDPGFATQDPEVFSGNKMTYYGRWTYKYEEAARQGAAGAIIIHETAPASYGWKVVKNSWSGPQFDLNRPDKNMSRSAIEGWVQSDVAKEIFALAGKDYNTLKQAASKGGFKPVPMSVGASIEVKNTIGYSNTYNVAGVVEGVKHKNETLLYTAHWDHLGTGPEVNGDSIYNGAVDNALGVAGILEIAGKFALAKKQPERSVVFLFVGAEEQGLLGAYHYAEQPAFLLDKTVALFNIDTLHPTEVLDDIVVVGRHSSELEEVLENVVSEQGRYLTAYPNPESGFYFRSDHFAFAKKGVPALYLHSGATHPVEGKDYITALKARYNTEIYHTPFDEYSLEWDLSGVVVDLQALHQVGDHIANQRIWPNWYSGVPFKNQRDEMRQQHK